MNAAILAIYNLKRKQYHHPLGISQGKARECLESAKRIAWSRANWGDYGNDGIAYSDDGNWRVRVVPDESHTLKDLEGDMFNIDMHADTVHGGKRTIEAQRKDFERKLEREGVWGYILERKIPACSVCGMGERWEHVDSCFGFDGIDYLQEYIEEEVMYQAK